jgi:putative aldouronate transport system substrate-binding protein
MVSEEFSIMTRWGEKGVDYLEPAASDKSLYADMGYKPSLKEVLAWGKLQNKHWAQQGPYVRQYSISAGVVWGGNPLDTNIPIAAAQKIYSGKKPNEVIPKLIFTAEENDAISETLITLRTYVKESLANFVTGGMDLDKDWESYKKQLQTIGVDKVVKTVQTVYDRMYKTKK